MNPWELARTAVELVILPSLWWILRRQGRGTEALRIATLARDLLSRFLETGNPLSEAKVRAIEELKKKGVPGEVARRAVAGAAGGLHPLPK